MNDQPQIRGGIPISVHPGVLTPVSDTLTGEKASGTPGPSAYAAGTEALGAIYTWLGAVQDADEALQASAEPAMRRQRPDGRSEYLGALRIADGRLRSYPDRIEEFQDAVHTSWERVALTVDRRTKELDGYLDTLDKQVAHALTDPNAKTAEGIALAGEIRGHIKALPEKNRFAFVSEAIASGDLPTVSAAINGPAFLSGMKPDDLGKLRILAANKFAPTAYAQRGAVQKVKDAIGVASTHLMARHAKALSMAETPRANANKKLNALKEAGK